MCGIVARFAYADRAAPIAAADVLRVRDSMWYRGPDAVGEWQSPDGRVVLGHRRLAIIDLNPEADQPMVMDDADLRIVFNGEIFNYRELREELRTAGARFKTASDTEAILQAYRVWGVEGLGRLQGMFAFTLWDGRRQSLLLARDPLGIKPLFYCDDGSQVLAASQVRAFAALGRPLTPDPVGHCGFFVNGSVPEPFTMFREIKAVPAGGYRLYGRDGVHEGSYFSLAQVAANAADTVVADADRDALIAGALQRSVRRHLIADVKVGIFLSGGVDSTLLAWLAQQSGLDTPVGLTLGAEEYRGGERDEIPLAADFAGRLGMVHQHRYVDADGFLRIIGDLADYIDQPSIDGVNTYLVSRMAQQFGFKVALSGLGGDELFAGYPGYRQIPRLVRAVQAMGPLARSGTVIRKLSNGLASRFASPKAASLIEFGGTYCDAYLLRRALHMPWEVRDLDGRPFDAAVAEAACRHGVSEAEVEAIPSPSGRIALLEMTRYMKNQLLRDSDWAGMAASLEIRVPFVDATLITELAPLVFGPRPVTKPQAVAAVDYPMGREIAARPKRGFGLPVREWMMRSLPVSQRGLRDWADHLYLKWCASVGTEPLVATGSEHRGARAS
jgi:asparagine synthase (glutamine-hydrolysing)